MRPWLCGLLALLALGASASGAVAQGRNHPVGPHDLHFEDPVTGLMIDVPSVAAKRCAQAACPLVIAMHGLTRNAFQTRDNWLALAEKHGLVVVAPYLDRERFPTRIYHQGGVLGETDPEKRPYALIERLFDWLIAEGRAEPDGYVLFGHSAGAQFVHRMVLFMPEARFRLAIAANAGFYTVPADSNAAGGFIFPYSLSGSPGHVERRMAAFARPLVILLGDQDTDPSHYQLNNSAGARAQGTNRLARGQFFFAAAQAEAHRLNTPLAWSLKIVPGIAHDNTSMAQAAAKAAFGAR